MGVVADAEPDTAHAARDGREAKRLQPDAAPWLSVWHPRRVRWRCSPDIVHNRRRSQRINLNGTTTVEQTVTHPAQLAHPLNQQPQPPLWAPSDTSPHLFGSIVTRLFLDVEQSRLVCGHDGGFGAPSGTLGGGVCCDLVVEFPFRREPCRHGGRVGFVTLFDPAPGGVLG